MITEDDIRRAIDLAAKTGYVYETPIVSYKCYKEMFRIIAEGWEYRYQPMQEAECWYYIYEWDNRKKDETV